MSRPDWKRDGADWPNREASRFVSAGGVRWHVQIMGEGPVLLLLHGTGAATHSWRDLMPRLATNFTVVAPDLPGHGFTQASQGSPTLPAMAALVAGLLRQLELRPVLVAGHSAGAAILLRMALDGSIVPQAIVSLNGALLPFPGAAAKLFPALAKLLFLNPLAPRLVALRAQKPGEVAAFLPRATGSRVDAAGLKFYTRLLRSSGHVAGALSMMANWDLQALGTALPRLGPPLVLVYGDADAMVPPAVSQRVVAMVPAELVLLPGLGHLAHEEAADEVAAIIVRVARDHAVL